MMSIPDKAVIIRKYSHATMLQLEMREPEDPAKGWADVQMTQAFEELGSGTVVPFKTVSAMLLYDGAGYAYDCHMAGLHSAVNYIGAQVKEYCKAEGVDPSTIESLPAKGALKIDIRTMVPREIKLKHQTGLTFFVNNEQKQEKSFKRVVEATNLNMLVQAGKILMDTWQKGSSWSAEPPKL